MSERVKPLCVLHGTDPAPPDRNMMKLAQFMGIAVEAFPVGERGMGYDRLRSVIAEADCIATRASTLLDAGCASELLGFVEERKHQRPLQLFVYGFSESRADDELLGALSAGGLHCSHRVSEETAEYSMSTGAAEFCREMSGMTFRVSSGGEVVFERGNGSAESREYASLGDRVFLASFERAGMRAVLCGSNQVVDIDTPLNDEISLVAYFTGLIPAMAFIRSVYGDHCWHVNGRQGCVIIDDPLLRPRHGFFSYDALLGAMKRSRFSTNIAFIPWNYSRSRKSVVKLFHDNRECLSLSVHGCDHIQQEFGGSDRSDLYAKSVAAKSRMETHRRTTGLSYDNIMVFPHGIFSAAALESLQRAGYLAAVNSTPFAVGEDRPGVLVRDVLRPAVMSNSGFPLFIRRYPREIAEFALDMFLGKAALIVEHHQYFRDGVQDLQQFVERINGICPDLVWSDLDAVAMNAVMQQRTADASMNIEYFCDSFRVENREARVMRYRIRKSGGAGKTLQRFALYRNGGEPAEILEGFPEAEFTLLPGASCRVDAQSEQGSPEPRIGYGSLRYRTKVRVRRYLCEIRDNYVHRILRASRLGRVMR